MKHINLPLDEEMLDRLDQARGDVPRTKWIRSAIQERLGYPTAETPIATIQQYVESAGLKIPVAPEPKPWVSKIPADAPSVEELRQRMQALADGFEPD